MIVFEYVLRLDLSRPFLFLFALYTWILLLLFRLTAGRLVGIIRREFAAPHYVMVVGTGERALRMGRLLEQSAEYGIRLRGFLTEQENSPPEVALGSVLQGEADLRTAVHPASARGRRSDFRGGQREPGGIWKRSSCSATRRASGPGWPWTSFRTSIAP